MADPNKNSDFSQALGITDTNFLGDPEMVNDFLSEDSEGLEEMATKIKKPDLKKKKKEDEGVPEEDKDPKDEIEVDIEKDISEELFTDEESKDEDNSKEDETEGDEEVEAEDESKEEPETNQFETLAKDLLRLGVFTEEEGEQLDIKTPDEFLARFNYEGQKRATNWLEGFLSRDGEDRRDLFDAIFIDRVDPREYLPVYNEVTSLEELDITQEPAQEKVFKEFYKRLGFSEEKIQQKLQKAKDYGDLEEESKEFYEQILKQDKDRLEEIKATKAEQLSNQQRLDKEYKEGITKILQEQLKKKEFKGIPINDKTAQQVFGFLSTPKYRSGDNLLTEFDKFILETKRPENYEKRVLIALLALNNFDFSKIKSSAISNESKELFTSLAKQKTKTKTPAPKPDSNSFWAKGLS